MLGYIEKIDILRLVGDSLAREESPSFDVLDREIENLRQEIESKKIALQNLNEQMDSYQADLDVQSEINNYHIANTKEDIRVLKEKSNVLATYINVLTSPNSDDFPIMKLKAEMDDYVKEFWAKLKPFNDRSKAVEKQLSELRQLRDVYMEAKLKADNSMI